MGLLPGNAEFGKGHEDAFAAVGGVSAWILTCGKRGTHVERERESHEGEFLGYSLVDDGWVDDETGHYL